MIVRLLLIFLLSVFVVINVQSQTDQNSESPNSGVDVSANTANDKTDIESESDTATDGRDKATVNEDFKPTEEISEDFPVSLPSDI